MFYIQLYFVNLHLSSFICLFIYSIICFLISSIFRRCYVKLRATKPKLTCCHNWGNCMRFIEHHKHHWKQSGLYSSIQKHKPAINHKPVYHCFSGQRSAVWNSRNDVSFCNADHRKMGLWRRFMPISRLCWYVHLSGDPSNTWFDSN